MSDAGIFDRHMLQVAFSEIDTVRRTLPESALEALAQEVVQRVAQNFAISDPRSGLPTSTEIDQLCEALLCDDPGAAAALIEDAQRKGSSYDAICLAYIGAASRRMGEMWEEDQVSFYRVTVAAGRIYAILRVLRLNRQISLPDLSRSAIFASVPGENHTLGITIATDLARDRGWDVQLFVGLSHEELVHKLQLRQPPLIGLSASGKRSLAALTKLIVALRISNPNSRILVCGQIATMKLSLVGITGADAASNSFDEAIRQMENLILAPRQRII